MVENDVVFPCIVGHLPTEPAKRRITVVCSQGIMFPPQGSITVPLLPSYSQLPSPELFRNLKENLMERAKTKCGHLKVVQCHFEQRLKGQ